MNRTGFAIAVGTLFCLSAAAQSQTGAQAGAQSSSQASVQAGQTQAQASGNASASTTASAQNGPSERFTGHWHGVQRRAELANRFEEVQAG